MCRACELLAIMGSSGAGKTTLLNFLAGRIQVGRSVEQSGSVTENGRPRNASWRRTAGYVEQNDIMYGLLTVQETIQFAADFKLPHTISPGEKRAIVDLVIDILGLNSVRYSRIGDETNRGISGGEKKRVAIGIELVTFPGLLFLDEPTTGLDSTTAQKLIGTLKLMADKMEMTIILAIDQPRTTILDMFTGVVFLSQRRLIFNGRIDAFLQHIDATLGIKCPERENPADFFMDLLAVDPSDADSNIRVGRLHDRWAEIQRTAEPESEITNDLNDTDVLITIGSESSSPSTPVHFNSQKQINNLSSGILTWPNSRSREFQLLIKRNFMLAWRDYLVIINLLVQIIIVPLLVAFVLFQLNDKNSGVEGRFDYFFFITAKIVFTTDFFLLPVFALDRTILLRERAGATYRVLPAFLAKFISLLPRNLIVLFVFSTPIYFIIGLTMPFDRFLVYVLILSALKLASISLGLMIASISPATLLSGIIGTLLVAIFIIFGGGLAIPTSITWVLRWIQYTSIIFYSYLALSQNEFNGNYYGPDQSIPGIYYLELNGLNIVNQWGCIVAMFGLGVAFLLMGYVGFRISTKPNYTY